jgi:hypothetical protein
MNATRRLTLLLAAALLLTGALQLTAATTRGTWTASISEKSADRMYLRTTRRQSENNGQTLPSSELANLTLAQINSASQVPVNFELRREAGTIAFEGVFKNGEGAGHFTFTPSSTYETSLRALGLSTDELNHRRDDDDDPLFQLAMCDVSSAFIRDMRAAGYRESFETYISMRIFRVTPQLVEEFRQIGFDHLPAQKLIAAQIHKATPAYIREMRAAGFTTLDLDDFVGSRIHGVTPEFAKQMKAAGYANLDHDDLMSFRIHKVTPEFIAELRDLGYRNIDADDLVAMRIHKVTPEFIREVRAAGYSNVPVEKLISMRIHNIDPKFISKMNGGH